MELSDLVFDPLHFVIHIDHSAGAVQQLIADILITVHFFDILLVTQLMLQSCPEIHTVGTDLDFCHAWEFFPWRRIRGFPRSCDNCGSRLALDF